MIAQAVSLVQAIPLVPRRLLALALPPRCAGCGAIVADDHRFCAECWGTLRFLTPPWCATCHVPFTHDLGPDIRCARCIARPPLHGGVRAAVAYGPVARTLALRLKYGGRTAFAQTAARQMARLVPDEVDLFVPVPLHRWRLWSRGFNQAALIADALATLTHREVDRDTLIRPRATPVLRGLGGKGRAKAVRGAFAIRDPAAVAGRTIALIDDVHTSGATVDACTRVLLRAGAARVVVLCWARVLAEPAD